MIQAALLLLCSFTTCLAQNSIWENGTDSVLVITQKMLIADPKSAFAHLQRGHALHNKEEEELAHEEYKLAVAYLSHDKLEINAIEDLGNILRLRLNDYAEAIKVGDYLLTKDSRSIEALDIKGFSCLRLGYNDQAIEAYKLLVDIAPKRSTWEQYLLGTYYTRLGNAYEAKNEFFKAVQSYTEAIQFGDNDFLTYSHRAKCKESLSDYRGALSDYDTSLSKRKTKDILYYGIMADKLYTKLLLKQYAEVVTDATTIISSTADKGQKAYAYYMRGAGKHSLKNSVGACYDWSKAGELGHEVSYEAIKKYCN
jgi:tetratricopeptide (TPR) repeat protein